ncbi:MAG TPA: TerC family protein [Bryobacteraceae bacterium]|nr:TerC family protein [Bryobacteraceae bacterium]
MEFLTTQFLLDVLAIVLIDLLLAGDNAVIIALAVKSLPPREKKIGIMVGAGLAVVLRIGLTFFAAQLLLLQFVKLVGGLLILWIAVKLLVQDSDNAHGKQASNLWEAMTYILIADITMSTDNILAIAGTSKGHIGLLIFGLGLSIPFVVFTSSLLSRIMDRFPIIVIIGSAILGRVGGEMIMTDPYVKATFAPPDWLNYLVQAVLAVGVVAAGKLLSRKVEATPKIMATPGKGAAVD